MTDLQFILVVLYSATSCLLLVVWSIAMASSGEKLLIAVACTLCVGLLWPVAIVALCLMTVWELGRRIVVNK